MPNTVEATHLLLPHLQLRRDRQDLLDRIPDVLRSVQCKLCGGFDKPLQMMRLDRLLVVLHSPGFLERGVSRYLLQTYSLLAFHLCLLTGDKLITLDHRRADSDTIERIIAAFATDAH